jgi:hypothetical protein
MDARAERATGGTGGADTGPTADARDSTAADIGTDAAESSAADAGDTGSSPADVIGDAAPPADVRADATACTRPTAPDGSVDATAPGTITGLTGYTASDVLYVTWSDRAGAVPRDRYLELRFDPSPGVCTASVGGHRKANGSQLRIFLLRANYLMWGTLPSFFVPGTYSLNENVYEQDAGFVSLAEVNLVTTDGTCQQTFARATSGNLTLTSVTPSHAAGSFAATFDDAGTISGGFDVDLCFDAELPECPYACVP